MIKLPIKSQNLTKAANLCHLRQIFAVYLTFTFFSAVNVFGGTISENLTKESGNTETKPELVSYQRKSSSWHAPQLNTNVPYSVYYKHKATTEEAPVIIYVRNHGYPRIGQESDKSIISDYIDEGYIVVTVNFSGNPEAISPNFDFDLLGFRRALNGYKTVSLLKDVNLTPQKYHCWILPAGCRIDRDVAFFELDKHGSFGTKQKILKVWNTTVRKKFGVKPLSDPELMHKPDGSPLDYKLYMDIIYPSQPVKNSPLWFITATQSDRMRMVSDERNAPHHIGFAMRGYVTAMIDHCWNPLARHDAYGYFDGGYTLDSWNGLKSNTAAIRFLRAHADLYGIDPERICGWGYSKGAYAITRLSDPQHESQKEHYSFKGFPKGSPQAQPWPGYSSLITAGYQAVGDGTRRTKYVQSRNIPTVIACGRYDQYKHWDVFPELVEVYESLDVNHLALWMNDLAHELPYGNDQWHDRNRYNLLMKFFDQYMKSQPPEILYVLPIDGRSGVSLNGYSQEIPDESMLNNGALEHVTLKKPITVHFGQRMNAASISNGQITIREKLTGQAVKGNWKACRDNTVFRFTPERPLRSGSKYMIEVTTAVKNTQGLHLSNPLSTDFTTIF